MFYHLLYPLHETWPVFNVFRYITFRTIYAALTALFLVFFLGPWFIERVRRLQLGQVVREDGPATHHAKAGTPSLGGLLIVGAVVASTLLWANLGDLYVWIVLLILCGNAGVGLVDDLRKVRYRNAEGLPARWKLVLQALVFLVAVVILVREGAYDTRLSVPFFKGFRPDLGAWYGVLAFFVVVGAANAVNLTDGLDGLATGPVVVTSAVYTLFAYLAGHASLAAYLQIPSVPGAGELAVFCGALVGAGLGFLWYNAHPAEIFMGDVGSLAMGGALGAVAVLSKQEILLAIVGGVFVAEACSVMLQVGFFKMTGGRRIFRMAPLHHHFELKGWPESKVIVRFWIVSVLLGLLAISTLKLR
ncbi:phospho-N-acetylmuramoyl-pentapeptide-transferase [Dissulfurirhabdus thermomarina]|uniref:Phospho-N-acetylmuramoyl-pentapeptide-transferase n=1 Tax=Dissulfurirhabdus thermomarina TaxID=1765737 RepID=A0A6N9TTD1_DISTH|nr:phospho-N-acetylmuramoyl-pentapeptide-transferase [Dissulfurirhabdus thermomarina]NDY43353.1 phospho-N-acetylmuramoyl-pentapeptide-transferase [Dissulfurirhabdus thermomarina]NMX24228.1 phospho-N-acetylmuramoyl-pentapeptide-transferase [Dissulfurirhabdus thermomarina]